MTAQIPDTFIFRGEEYSLIGIKGGELFLPSQYGMAPVGMSTGCYRGFYASYELTEEGELFLREAWLGMVEDDYKPIGGVLPDPRTFFEGNNDPGTYKNLNVLIPFTGKIRLAKDFIDDLYVHMGFQKPSAFATVVDLTLQGGLVVEVKDRSEEIEKRRGEFYKRSKSPSDIGRFVDDAFDLDMDLI